LGKKKTPATHSSVICEKKHAKRKKEGENIKGIRGRKSREKSRGWIAGNQKGRFSHKKSLGQRKAHLGEKGEKVPAGRDANDARWGP